MKWISQKCSACLYFFVPFVKVKWCIISNFALGNRKNMSHQITAAESRYETSVGDVKDEGKVTLTLSKPVKPHIVLNCDLRYFYSQVLIRVKMNWWQLFLYANIGIIIFRPSGQHIFLLPLTASKKRNQENKPTL